MNGTQPTIVVVTEKPSFVRALAPFLSKRWPEHRVIAVMTLYLGLYEFRYPRGLSANDYPFLSEPRWKPRSAERQVTEVMEIFGETARRIDLPPPQALEEADQIVFAADADAAGAVAFHVLLEQTLGTHAATLERPAFYFQSMVAEDLGRAVEAGGSTGDARFQTWLRAGQARRFFDYNFNVNALNLFGEALRHTSEQAAQVAPQVGMSKYGLQLLYFLRGQSIMGVAEVIWSMQRWKGTGKYAGSDVQLDSASQQQIITNLLALGLIACPRTHDNRQECQLTDAGTAFLDRVHPDCQDPDLPFRIRQWEAAWPASRPAMERYLRTFFGKQKRYARSATVRAS